MKPWSVNEVTNYLRGFLGDASKDHWPARLMIVYVVLVGFWEVLDAWIENVKGSADEFQLRGLNSVQKDLEKLVAPLQAVGGVLAATRGGLVPAIGERPLLWANVAVPMVMDPFSIAARLTSLRNQLVAYGVQPISGTSILTSQGITELLPQWSQPIPDWWSELFLSSASKAIVATEKSAPGEPPTARDVGEAVAKEYAAKGKAAVGKFVEKLKEVATPWVSLAIVGGILYLAKK